MTLADLLGRFETYEEDRDGFRVHCPAHDDSEPSLRLTVSDSGKVLLRCRAGCETADVLAALGLTMKDLATMTAGDVELAHRAASRDVPASPADVAKLAVKLDKYAEAYRESPIAFETAVQYAAQRFGVTGADAERLGLGYADDLGGGPRLVVPFRDKDGVARGFQARALDKDASVRWLGPKSPEGASWAKVAWFEGSTHFDEVLICEGPGDALTGACALGYDTIGVRGAGLAANPAVVESIMDLLDGRDAIVAGDGDPAGRRFSADLARALAEAGATVRVLELADGLDLTDWRTADPRMFETQAQRAIADAAPVSSTAAALMAWDEERYSLSDLGGARYLRDYIVSKGSGVRFTEEGGFYLLDHGVWRRDEQQAVRTAAQEVADILRNLSRAANGEAGRDGASDADKRRAKRLNSYAYRAQTTNGLDAMVRELQAVTGVPASINDFDTHPHLLAVRNGVIDLRTGELMPHDPNLMLSKRVDVDYDPDARAPRWEQFLREVFPHDPELPPYLQRLIGYGITGDTRDQCFAVHWGTGANGKSVFHDVLAEVFGEHAVVTPFSTFEAKQGNGGIPNDIAALKGARLVMAAEGEQGKPMAEALLKRITGGDRVTARFMRREFFSFKPEFLLMLATNYKPTFKGQDEGLWRRVKLIAWKRYFEPDERDPQLTHKLCQEAQGILTWAVKGARQWYASGLRDPAAIREATREYRQTSDALAGFLPGVYVLDPESTRRITGKLLYSDYVHWTEEEGLNKNEVWRRRTFFGALDERGVTRRGSGSGVYFEGIRRLDDTTHHEEEEEAPQEEAPKLTGPSGAASLTDI